MARNAYNTYRQFCQTDDLWYAAELEEKAERDYYSILAESNDAARAEGEARGKAEGEALGEARGKAEGLLQLLAYRFSCEQAASLEPRIRSITSLQKLDDLFVLAMSAVTFEDFEAGI